MSKKSVYMVGIKGVAMTAMAVYLKEKGYKVEGSDVNDVFITDEVLEKYNIRIKEGFKPENLNGKYDFAVVTGAHGGMTNPEALFSRKSGIPTYMHGEMLGKLMEKNGFNISVSGCHGKTTTSSLISFILTKSGSDPSYTVGTAQINGLGPAGHFGKGKVFIAEADEYMTCPQTDKTPRFLWQSPNIAVITNIEYDHPDAYKDLNEVMKAFIDFTHRLRDNGTIIACIDSPTVRKILPEIGKNIITYGFSPQADFRITNFSFGDGISFMNVSNRLIDVGQFSLKIPGRHNLLNGLAAAIAANQSGVGWEKIRKYLKSFTGSKRRFEKISQSGKILLYDDYAHHPSEIAATISAAKEWFPDKRLLVLFQPHTFSRTKSLFDDFARAFTKSDIAVITDIYPSKREKIDPTISSNQLVIAANRNRKNAVYIPSKQDILLFLRENIKDNDLILTMGAGDVFSWHHDIEKILKEKK